MTSHDRSGLLTIGEACRLTGFNPSALRFYESIDLLEPDWVDPVSGYRYYQPEKLYFLNFLKSMRDQGFPLQTIKPLIAKPRSDKLDAAIGKRLAAVEAKLAVLRRQRAWLLETREKLNLPSAPFPGTGDMWEHPGGWEIRYPGTVAYDFRDYAQARHWLTRHAASLDLPWLDCLICRMPLIGTDDWDDAAVEYSLPLDQVPTHSAEHIVNRPAGVCLRMQVAGPLERVAAATRRLLAQAREQGLNPASTVEWHHLLSTAHTLDPTGFLTAIILPLVRRKPD